MDSTQDSVVPTPQLGSRAGSTASESSFKSTQQTAGAQQSTHDLPQAEDWKIPSGGSLTTPIPRALNSTNPVKRAPLTAEEETKYTTVLNNVSRWRELPSTTVKNAPLAPITEHERMWLTRECLLRYLRATKWVTAKALERLQATLSWRREYGADTFTAEYISPENETGKQVILGYDIDARPCLYLNPGKQNTKMSDRQIHHLSYMLDRVVDMMGPGQETTALLINFKGAKSGTVPTVGQARQVLNILQGHNPERLGRALISELPWYVNTFFKLISGFIDPVTKDKMKFNEDLRQWVPPTQLWNQSGGDLDFEYDHAQYWPALTEECARRRAAYKKRWEAGGMKIGEFEEYLRGGDHPPLKDVAGETQDPDLNTDMAKLKMEA